MGTRRSTPCRLCLRGCRSASVSARHALIGHAEVAGCAFEPQQVLRHRLKLRCQFFKPPDQAAFLGQFIGHFVVFLLVGLLCLLTEFLYFAIGLGLSFPLIIVTTFCASALLTLGF